MAGTKISHERLLEVLNYNPETGELVWRKPVSPRAKVGSIAGCIGAGGYRQVKIDGRLYYAHRLAIFYVAGEWPEAWVDHANRDQSDNRFCNLRQSSVSQNAANKKTPVNNTIGFKGVNRSKKKYAARIKCEGVRYNLGVFDTPEDAHAAYFSAAQRLFGEFARAA